MNRPRYADIFAGHDDGGSMAEYANVLWERYKDDLEARGLFNRVRADILDRYVRYKVEHDHYHPIAVSQGPVKVGPNGGECVNMTWSMVQKLADRLERLEKSLTLSPESVGEKVVSKKNTARSAAADSYLDQHVQ